MHAVVTNKKSFKVKKLIKTKINLNLLRKAGYKWQL